MSWDTVFKTIRSRGPLKGRVPLALGPSPESSRRHRPPPALRAIRWYCAGAERPRQAPFVRKSLNDRLAARVQSKERPPTRRQHQRRITLSKEAHQKAAEHHEKASKAHRSAVEAFGQGDPEKAEELGQTAHDHSERAHEASRQAREKSGKQSGGQQQEKPPQGGQQHKEQSGGQPAGGQQRK